MNQVVHLRYPLHDVRAGSGVLSAALSLFGAADPVQLLISPIDGSPSRDQIDAFRRLRGELTLPYGPPPETRIVDGPTAEAATALVRVDATGDPVRDAQAILALGSVGRHFGSAYGVAGSRLRGAPHLVRTELDAAFRHRQAHPRRARDGRVRIAVVTQRVQVWGAVSSIVLSGMRSDDVELDLVLVEDHLGAYRRHATDEFAAFCSSRDITLRDEGWLRLHLEEIDVVLVPDPYITPGGTSPGLSLREVADRGIRLVLSPYAQDLSGDVRVRSLMHNLAFHNIAWRIFAPSPGAKDVYARTCTAGGEHVRYVGNPKREHLLVDEAATPAAAELRRRLGTRSVILWNPHFVGDDGRATFATMAEPILAWFGKHPSHGLIVRPHPRLFADYERAGHGDTIASFRSVCRSMPNVLLDESIDAAAAMLAADAMISDLSSLMAEYHALGRPIGLLRPTPELALNEEDRDCLDASTMIDDARGLARFLERVRATKPTSRDIAAEGHQDLGAGARIIETIVREYRLEAGAHRRR